MLTTLIFSLKIILLSIALMPWLFANEDVFLLENDLLLNFNKIHQQSVRDDNKRDNRESNKRAGFKTMPIAPSSPSYSGIFTLVTKSVSFTFWRQTIDNIDYLFLQATPRSPLNEFFLCPQGEQFSIIQNNIDYGKAFSLKSVDVNIVCKDITTTEVFVVSQISTSPNFDENETFTIVAKQQSLVGSVTVLGATATPTPTPTTSPTTTVTPTASPSPSTVPTATPNPSDNRDDCINTGGDMEFCCFGMC